MIAIQAIALATIRRFLNLRPDGSCCSSTEQSIWSAIIGVSLENCPQTNDSSDCRCFDLLKPIIGEFMTRDAIIPAGRLRDVTYLSVNKVAQNDGTTDINCISWMLRPFDFEIESNLR
jgi:hypothetical protein